jgi:hypothetical protein
LGIFWNIWNSAMEVQKKATAAAMAIHDDNGDNG